MPYRLRIVRVDQAHPQGHIIHDRQYDHANDQIALSWLKYDLINLSIYNALPNNWEYGIWSNAECLADLHPYDGSNPDQYYFVSGGPQGLDEATLINRLEIVQPAVPPPTTSVAPPPPPGGDAARTTKGAESSSSASRDTDSSTQSSSEQTGEDDASYSEYDPKAGGDDSSSDDESVYGDSSDDDSGEARASIGSKRPSAKAVFHFLMHPGNYILIALIAFAIGLTLLGVAPALLAAAAAPLAVIGAVSLSLAAVGVVFSIGFYIRKLKQERENEALELEQEAQKLGKQAADVRNLSLFDIAQSKRVVFSIGSYTRDLDQERENEASGLKQEAQKLRNQAADVRNLSLFDIARSKFEFWLLGTPNATTGKRENSHFVQATFVFLGIAAFITAMVLIIGFFASGGALVVIPAAAGVAMSVTATGGGAFAFMAPVFAAMATVVGASGVAMTATGLAATVGTFIALAPLNIANTLKRFTAWLDYMINGTPPAPPIVVSRAELVADNEEAPSKGHRSEEGFRRRFNSKEQHPQSQSANRSKQFVADDDEEAHSEEDQGARRNNSDGGGSQEEMVLLGSRTEEQNDTKMEPISSLTGSQPAVHASPLAPPNTNIDPNDHLSTSSERSSNDDDNDDDNTKGLTPTNG